MVKRYPSIKSMAAAGVIALAAIFILSGWEAVNAQTPRISPTIPASQSSGDPTDITDPQSPIADMMAKRRINLAEKEHKENLDRAREVAQIGSEVLGAFKKNRTLSQSEFKKIDRIEKLAKKIRDEAGGSESESELKQIPHDLDSALERVSDLTRDLREDVEKTSRMVVSAAVIDRANELIEVIKIVRGFRSSPS
jgi:hypothetical protein